MKITVIGGSPKGEISVTIQYVRYIEKLNPQHDFSYVYPAQRIGAILKDSSKEKEIFDLIKGADLVLWAFPLYYMNVHGSLKRFIETALAHHRDAFQGKYTAALCTSILFYDHLALNYIQAVSEDLNMQFIDSFSAKMEMLLEREGQERTAKFADFVFSAVEEKAAFSNVNAPLPKSDWTYKPNLKASSAEPIFSEKKILVVTDTETGNTGSMIRKFTSCFDSEIETVNITKLKINGHCLGCLKCGDRNVCAYEGKDDYIDFYRNKIMKADILVWAGETRDRYLSWQWKQFFDRSFFKTHQPVLDSKQFVFLISGPFSRMQNLKETLAVYVEMEGSRVAAFISDDREDSSRLDDCIESAARLAVRSAEADYNYVFTCRAEAGRKIFRDEIDAGLKVVFRADHRAYKRTGYYDFKNNNMIHKLKTGMAYLITGIPAIKKQMRKYMIPGMIRHLKKIPESNSK